MIPGIGSWRHPAQSQGGGGTRGRHDRPRPRADASARCAPRDPRLATRTRAGSSASRARHVRQLSSHDMVTRRAPQAHWHNDLRCSSLEGGNARGVGHRNGKRHHRTLPCVPRLGHADPESRARHPTRLLQYVAQFARHFGQSPADLGPEDLRAFQVHLLHERHVAPRTLIVAVAALRFYTVTLKSPWRSMSSYLPRKSSDTCRWCSAPRRSLTSWPVRRASRIAPSSRRAMRPAWYGNITRQGTHKLDALPLVLEAEGAPCADGRSGWLD